MRAEAPKSLDGADRWIALTAAVIVAVTALRLILLAYGHAPVHFDEAQYWTYGEALDWGYYSKPPLTGALIRVGVEVFGDTQFGLRVFAPLLHALIAGMIFATARRLFSAEIGFWAAAGYLLAPGVGVSSGVMSTDPVAMAGIATGLYAMTRGMTGGGLGWWIAAGVAAGLALLGKYTAIAFPLSALGYALFSRAGPMRPAGALAMGLAALAVIAPNLAWNAANDFATIAHVGENARLDGPLFSPTDLLEFFGAQFGVIGPVFFGALGLVLWRARTLWAEPRWRFLMWLTFPLLFVMLTQAFLSRAHPNWAAPAYVPGAILAAAILIGEGRRALARAQLILGAIGCVAFSIGVAVYADAPETLSRLYDPMKKARLGGVLCPPALAAMEAEGADALLSDDRRRLAECMFEGGLAMDRIAVWNPDGGADNHYQLVASLKPGDSRVFLLAMLVTEAQAAPIAARFERAKTVFTGEARTHADRAYPLTLMRLEGYRG